MKIEELLPNISKAVKHVNMPRTPRNWVVGSEDTVEPPSSSPGSEDLTHVRQSQYCSSSHWSRYKWLLNTCFRKGIYFGEYM